MKRTLTKAKLPAAIAAMLFSGALFAQAAPGTTPGATEQQPGYGQQQPGVGEQQPGMGERQPGLGEQQPGVGERQPGVGMGEPGVTVGTLTDEQRELLQSMDKQGTGEITRDELLSYFEEHADNDRLGPAEFAAFMKTDDAQQIQAKEDLKHEHRALFDQIDKAGDGHITRDELIGWFEQHAVNDRLTEQEFAAFVQGEDTGISPMEPRDPAMTPTPERDPTMTPGDPTITPGEPRDPTMAPQTEPAPPGGVR
jgi:Ca2+-binding EF-hand superfamily protein